MRRLVGTLVVAVLAGLVWGAFRLAGPGEAGPATGLTVRGVLGGSDTGGYARATEVIDFEFPRDHGAHPDFRTEWWYVTGNLRDTAGNRFGLQWTLFRSALAPDPVETEVGTEVGTKVRAGSDWATRQAYMAHFALTDVARGEFRAWERFARGAQGLAGAQLTPFRVWLEDWELATAAPGSADAAPGPAEAAPSSVFPLRLRADEDGRSVRLTLTPLGGPVLQGESGLSQKAEGAGNASYYYSYTRLEASGEIHVGDEVHVVEGTAWLDREWSTAVLADDQVGWDWFALQLSDGRDLMYYQLRRPDGSAHEFSEGVLVGAGGDGGEEKRRLEPADVELRVTERWRSPDSGIEYPAGWRLRIRSESLDLRIRPVMADQELELTFRYWEGAVDVTGTGVSAETSGVGYVEMTGYGADKSGGRTEARTPSGRGN